MVRVSCWWASGRWFESRRKHKSSFWIFRLLSVDHSSANIIQMKSSMTFIQSNGWTEVDLILKEIWRRYIWWQVSFKFNSSCSSSYSPMLYPPAGHAVTGDLKFTFRLCYVAVCNNYAFCNTLQTALNCNAVCNQSYFKLRYEGNAICNVLQIASKFYHLKILNRRKNSSTTKWIASIISYYEFR